MSKKYSTTQTLIIVESPAKCKKIEEYLGPGYKCVACFGHIRELSSLKNIDFNDNFKPTYTIIENKIKQNQIEILRKEINLSSDVIIATDDDREGESIGWHICDIFNLNIEKTKRIVFHEITEIALQKAILNPQQININIVNSQKTRQILDLLVGFKISPMLWKFISQNKKNSLSAGRCQTPALKIIYDNHKEIISSENKKLYNIIGYFTSHNIPFELNKHFELEEEILHFLNSSINFSHIYTCSLPKIVVKPPPEPFTTSVLQQKASNELHYSPKETMTICQSLYEKGYITYMRTDCKKYSNDFIIKIKEYILRNYDEKYINQNIENITLKNDDEICFPHESIRPTNILLFELPKEEEDKKEKKMYKLIWENTLESCMSSCLYNSITANISSVNNLYYTYTSENINFPGWKIVTKKYSNDKEYQFLQTIKQNTGFSYKKIISNTIITGTKHHYTEAKLVNILEEKGIGRPSTFSIIIDKIQERGYVKKDDIKGKEIECKDFGLENDKIYETISKKEFGNEKGKLIIQPIGIMVIDFLYKYFNDLFDYKYTKMMEDNLDKISRANFDWVELCSICDLQIDSLIEKLKDVSKIEIKIDDKNTYLIGKYGPVIKHLEITADGKEEVSFKATKKDIDIHKIENGEYNVEDIVDEDAKKKQIILGKQDGDNVILKKGKYGLYISWGENSKALKDFGNRPIENITFDEIKPYLTEEKKFVREITPNISLRSGPKGDYIFYKTNKMKKPQFFSLKNFKGNYKTDNINKIKEWIKSNYDIML
jgi:DNA topoisomerase-1